MAQVNTKLAFKLRHPTFILCLAAPAGLFAFALSVGRPEHFTSKDMAIAVRIDPGKILGRISPYIYGMAAPGPEHYRLLHVPLFRWGGNPATRYNWKRGNSWNSARDWRFANVNYGAIQASDRRPSGAADQAIESAKAHGADTLLTIPTMGWVARDDDSKHRSLAVPEQGGPPISSHSEAISGYDPTANRRLVSLPSLPRKVRPFRDPPDPADPNVYEDEWIYHLIRRFGRAQEGGVRFYAMDNEPDLWDNTHTDMHPVRPDYEEIWRRFSAYAEAVKAVDPTAQVTGPVLSGWSGLFFSPRDRGDDNFASHAERRTHDNMAFLPWFLRQAAAHDARVGKRTLDVLDVHFYPQGEGIYSGLDDARAQALRLRQTRSLWDPDYRDESWIRGVVQLIPRLRAWVQAEYPGTKIGLTEWNWGAEGALDGGLAVADVLGILGREGVDMACYWRAPPIGSPAFMAYRMYRNADGEGHGFGEMAVSTTSSDETRVSCFGAIDRRGEITAMLINKSTQAQRIRLSLAGPDRAPTARVFRYPGDNLKSISHLPDIKLVEGKISLLLPGYSITLLKYL